MYCSMCTFIYQFLETPEYGLMQLCLRNCPFQQRSHVIGWLFVDFVVIELKIDLKTYSQDEAIWVHFHCCNAFCAEHEVKNLTSESVHLTASPPWGFQTFCMHVSRFESLSQQCETGTLEQSDPQRAYRTQSVLIRKWIE